MVTNDTNGVQEDEYNIDPNKNWFVLLFKDVTTRLLNEDDIMDNYNRVLATEYVKFINTKIDVFMQTNILSPKQVWGLKQILKAIRFNSVIPLLERCREKAFRLAEKDLFKTISHIRGLRYSKSNYILFNSPVDELKPFLSDKVAEHNINTCALITLLKHFTSFKYKELNTFGFEPINVRFVAKKEDFYKDRVIDSGVGEEVEEFIWSKMMEKVEILKQGNKFLDDADQKIAEIDYLLKRLKLNKIEKMLQEIIVLKTNIAQAKEVVDSCMDLINTSVIPHKDKIFLAIDNMFYKLSKKCETLQQKAKQKLQLIDKEKIFEMVEVVE